jgi:imidazolonepropionase-like amidohydrolase
LSAVSAIFGDALLDPTTGRLTPNAVVVVEDGRIRAAGDRSQVSVPADAARVDGEGLTLLPGLIDCHVHLSTHGDGLDLGQILVTPPSLSILTCVVSARKTLEAGFTTVRDAGMTPAGVRTAIERGYFPGPRLLVAITILSQTGGHADDHFPCGAFVRWVKQDDIPPELVDGVEPMRLRVRQILRAGADWIKICTSGGVLSPNDDPHHAHFTVEEIRAAVEEAARAGRRVMSHAQAADGIKNALRAGVHSIEHGIYLDEDGIEMMLDGGNPLVPTLVAPVWVERHAAAGKMAPYAAVKAREVAKDHKANVRRAIEAGVKVAFGTDTGVGPHGSNGEEFLQLAELGMSPLDAIRSATTVAAEAIGLKDRVGTLAEGAWADLVGVPGNPLENLELVARPVNVHLVVKGGEAVKARS